MPGIVIEPLKSVYWPIPKNACTALKRRIALLLGFPDPPNPHDAPFTYADFTLPGYEDFAIVRHPLARIYSLWANKLAPGHPVAPDFVDNIDPHVFSPFPWVFRDGMSFDAFLQAIISIPVGSADPHWAPQVTQMPPKTKFYRIEDVGTLLRLAAPAENTSVYPETPPVGRELARLVRAYYAEDFSVFGYPLQHPLFP
jgi:hypothetical protein